MENIALNKEVAVKRMSKRKTNSISWTLALLTVRWEYISAISARNWEGAGALDGQDPSKTILQLIVWRDGSHPRYTNFW